MYGSEQQEKVSSLLIGGVIAFVVGIVLVAMASVGQMGADMQGERGVAFQVVIGIGALAILGGLASAVASLVVGAKHALGRDEKAPVQRHPGAYIISKLVLTHSHDPVYDREIHDDKDLRFLVQVHHANGSKVEYKTDPAVFDSIPEGGRGTVTSQGQWLCQFVWDVRPGAEGVVDPFRGKADR